MINDSQARAILLKFDDDAPIVQGMQALAKALSKYGYPNGWITPDNNWFNVATAPGANGQCINVVGLATHPVPGGTCAFTYHTPEQGIAHAMELWIPRSSDAGINADSKAFIEALLNGDTDTVVKFAIQRVWGIGPREASIVALGPMAAWTLGSDFYNSAAAIAKALGEPLYFKMPSIGSLPIQIVPLPIQLVPVPLPSGKFPARGPVDLGRQPQALGRAGRAAPDRCGGCQGAEVSHPLAARLRQRPSRVGAPLPFIPIVTKTDVLSVIAGKSNTVDLLKNLQDASQESANLQIPGIDPEAVQGYVLQAALQGGTDPKVFLEKFFSMGGALACTAVGGAALAPLCAAGGKVVGEAVAGFQVKPVGPGPSAAGDALQAQLDIDRAYLTQQRDALYYSLSARFNSAPEAMKQVEAILKEFYDGFGCTTPQADGQCLYNRDAVPCGESLWTAKSGGCSAETMGPYAGGFFMPFYVVDGCALLGKNYSAACGGFWEWELDFSTITSGGQHYPPPPGWIEAMSVVMQGILKQRGLDVDAAFDKIRAQAPAWYKLPSGPDAMRAFYVALKMALWPALQMALEKRLQAVVVDTAVRANAKLVLGIDAVALEMAKRAKCPGGACFDQIKKDVQALAMKLPGKNVAEVAKQVEEVYPPTAGQPADQPADQPSKARPVVALGVTVGLLYLLHRAIKRYVL